MTVGGASIPFDIQDIRTIRFRLNNPDYIQKAQDSLREQVRFALAERPEISNPITAAIGRAELRQSGDSRDQLLARLSTGVSDVEQRLGEIEQRLSGFTPSFYPDTTVGLGQVGGALSSLQMAKPSNVGRSLRRNVTLGELIAGSKNKNDDTPDDKEET